MASKYLNSLSEEEYGNLTLKLHSIQDGKCFICGNIMDLKLNTTNIDHIIPLANRGRDSDENFALTHESCNKSKQDADLGIARILYKLKTLQDKTIESSGKSVSLKDVEQFCNINGQSYLAIFSIGQKLEQQLSIILTKNMDFHRPAGIFKLFDRSLVTGQ